MREMVGYENGIFVEGKLRDEFLATNPDITEAEAKDPAGYNLRGMESERPVTVQIFDSEGTDLLTQHCGLRISGNYTRGKSQKSLQLFARSSYDEHGRFHVTLFPETLKKLMALFRNVVIVFFSVIVVMILIMVLSVIP